MFKFRAVSFFTVSALVLLSGIVASAQHEVGGGVASDAAVGSESRSGSRVRRAPTRTSPARRPAPPPVRRGITADQYNQQGDTFFEAENYDEAFEAYTKAVQLKPIASAFYHLGWINNDREDYSEALTALQQAVRLNPNYAPSFYELGYALRHLKRHDEAMVAYRASVGIDPNYARAYYDIGFLYNELKQYSQAIQPLKQAASL